LTKQPEKEFIKAAGGLVWRDTQDGQQLLLIHRERYDDWSLPKGKLEPGETWPEAARREVAEETGFSVTFLSFAGVTTYFHGRRPKVVLFWNMTVSGEIDAQTNAQEGKPEVDEMKWLNAADALELLTYPAEQTLIAENLARQP
jgi:8-oxo-dGTP diphosphatase